MKKVLLVALMVLALQACKENAKETSADIDAETAAETDMKMSEDNEWTELSLDDWQAFKGGPAPEFWKEEDGAIVFYPPSDEARMSPDGERKSFNIVTKNDYSSFVLSLEWKISDTGNSGIMWGVSEEDKYKEPYHTGLEIQVLDNEKHPDAKNGTTHQAGALYDLVEPSEDATKPVGEWNLAEITVDYAANKGSSVLNGVEVATFPVGGPELDQLLKGSKFDGWDGFGKFKTGKIALQDHGDVVAFRNIKIKELK
ncbi:DUF1080 domain-containing protein [Maribacter algicola]|uniref:DUF1080 domain-containing protein n=1 Tax=Meishania litoralis TaxID=3434685 RepID=A0ACC7LGV6_9FLAO